VSKSHLKKYKKLRKIHNLLRKCCQSPEKTLANRRKIVYACMRYPISVSRTVLVQNIRSHAGKGDRQAGDIRSDMDPSVPPLCEARYQHTVLGGPSWVSLTKPFAAVSAEMILYLQRVNRSSTSKKVSWMNPVAALPAVRLAAIRLVVQVGVRNVPHVRCTQSFALSAESRRKCRSFPRTTAPSIAAPAMTRCA